jgi:hypothetical protein
MKSKEEIERMVKVLQNEINDLHREREILSAKNGGVLEEYNEAFFCDLSFKSAELSALNWVLGINEDFQTKL